MYFRLMVAILLNHLKSSLNQCSWPILLFKKKIRTKIQSCLEGVDVDVISPLPRTLLIRSSASDM